MRRCCWIIIGIALGCGSDQPDFGSSGAQAPEESDETLIPPFNTGNSPTSPFAFPTSEGGDTPDAFGGGPDTESPPRGTLEDEGESDAGASSREGSETDAGNAPGFQLSCLQTLQCTELCASVPDEVESIACQSSCEESAATPLIQETAEALFACMSENGCTMGDVSCAQLACPEAFGLCETDGVGDINVPGEQSDSCGESGGTICPEKAISPLSVEIVDYPTGVPPTLTGGELQPGVYGLKRVEFYSGSMLIGAQSSLPIGWEIGVGNSNGSIRIEPDAWRIFANIETEISVVGLGTKTHANQVDGGGCITVEEGVVYSDVYQCFEGSTGGAQAATAYPYQVNGTDVHFLMQTSRDDVLESMEGLDPVSFNLANTLLVNDLQFILVMTPL